MILLRTQILQMLVRNLRPSTLTLALRSFSTSKQSFYKVTVAGATGGIGQPLSLLFKQSPLVTNLALYDITNAPGIATDLSHIDTPCTVCGFGPDKIKQAFENADIVEICAGLPRKAGMTRDQLFSKNASIMKDLAKVCADVCPSTIICVITNPVNSLVPVIAEVLTKERKFDPKRLFGVTTLDIIRANFFLSELEEMKTGYFNVPVIGGHSNETIVPVFSQSKPSTCLKPDQIKAIVHRVRTGGNEVINAKGSSATLSMAYAAAKLAFSLMHAMNGKANVIECAYVPSNLVKEVKYFASPVLLGEGGVEKILPLGDLTEPEKALLAEALPILQKNIEKGEQFVACDEGEDKK